MSEDRLVWLFRAGLLVAFFGGWELYGRLVNSTWTSEPSQIAVQIVEWARTELARHLFVTLSEIAVGLSLGVPCGILLGIWLGRTPTAAALLRPFIVGLNSVPVVALAPILIMWFGLGMTPKVALVTLVAFLFMFFNTFAGAQSVDRDWIEAIELMGGTRREQFAKVVLPACVVWILSGLKNTLPYALIAATIGEMMVSREGLGALITQSSGVYNMTGLYAALVILMALGVIINELATRGEARLLRWRPVVDQAS